MRTKSLLLLLSCLLFSSLFYLLLPNFPSKLYPPDNFQFQSPSSSSSPSAKYRPNGPLANGIYNSNEIESIESTSFAQHSHSLQSIKLQEQQQQVNDHLSLFISSTESTYLFDQIAMDIDTTCKPKFLAQNVTIDTGEYIPTSNSTSLPLPVFVSAIQSGDGKSAVEFVKQFQNKFANGQLILYSLNMVTGELDLVNQTCSNHPNCSLRQFDFKKYPPHVSNLQLNAFRPIIIHEVLDATGSIIWLNIDHLPQSVEKATRAFISSKTSGIYSWTVAHKTLGQPPTTSLTHPKMFEILKSKREFYYFHRMVNPASLIVLNYPHIHNKLIIPWVKCSLVLDCISPIGAQSSGCRFDKKPLYRYSGCHLYDMSALNVLLGSIFNYNEKPYAGTEDDKFFSTPQQLYNS